MYLISNNFLKEVPAEKREFVIKRLNGFIKELARVHKVLNKTASGFWVRKLRGTDILKFRVNNGDRILFKFAQIGQEDSIVFLHYCTHNQQVVKGRRTSAHKNRLADFAINYEVEHSSEENQFDNEFLNQHASYFDNDGHINIEKYILIIGQIGLENVLIKENSEEYLYYLKNNQSKYLDINDKQIILSGCPGSGKTLLAVHKLLAYAQKGLRCVYFTRSKLLINNTKDLFKKYCNKNESCVSFYTLDEYFKIITGKKEVIINERQFEYWYNRNKTQFKLKKEVREVWSEIRGILCGFMGYNWERMSKSNEDDLISFDEYLNIPEDYSCFEKNEREKVYQLAEKYANWLKKENQDDYNSLARRLLRSASIQGRVDQYDFIIIDEIQDFSEVEIAALLNSGKPGCLVMLSGDIRQCICPNYFDFKRIRNLFFKQKTEYKEVYLDQSFRNSKQIVDLMNHVTKLRNEFIEPLPKPFQSFDQSHIIGNMPALVISESSEGNELLKRAASRPEAAIVVPNEDVKDELNFIDEWGRVFTVDEIKGLQYDTIICYKFSSARGKRWQEIFSKRCKYKLRYHYDLNLLYTAISRARKELVFYEEKIGKDDMLIEKLRPYLEENAEKIINFSITQKKDWLKEANRLELSGNYTQAKKIYEKLNNKDGIKRCNIEHENNRKLFESNVDALFNLNKMKTTLRIEDEKPLNAATVGWVLNNILSNQKIEISPEVEIIAKTKDDSRVIMKKKLIDCQNRIGDISNIVSDILQKQDMVKTQATLELELLKDGHPTYLLDLNGKSFSAIKIMLKRDNLSNISDVETTNLGDIKNKQRDAILNIFQKDQNKLAENIDEAMSKIDNKNFYLELNNIINLRMRSLALVNNSKYDNAISILNEGIKLQLQQELLMKEVLDAKKQESFYQILADNYSDLGLCYLNTNRFELCEKCLTKALEYKKNHKEAMYNLTCLYNIKQVRQSH